MAEDILSRLINKGIDDKTARMIMKELIEAEKDSDLKTHLSEEETLTFSKADFYAEEMGNSGFLNAKKIINFFSDRLMRKRFSFNRMSRLEFGEGLKSEMPMQMQDERNRAERLIR